MKITRLRISNFLGVEHLDATIPPAGAIATGSNAVGKTTVLKAIHAALAAQGIGPEAVRLGADRAEILLDMDAVTVRRAISSNGNSLTVTTAEGDRWAKPQTRLTNLLGATLDPLAFYLASPAERRKLILAAMPVEVTAEDLQRWTGEEWTPKAGMHGLEVVADVRKHYYDMRAEANKVAKAAVQAAQDAAAKAAALARPELEDVRVPDIGDEDAEVRAAELHRESIVSRRKAAEEQTKRSEGTRARIAELRRKADDKENNARPTVPVELREQVVLEWRAAGDEVVRLEDLLVEAKEKHHRLSQKLDDIASQDEQHAMAMSEAAKLRAQSDDLEQSLASVAVTAPTDAEIAAANETLAGYRDRAKLVKEARVARSAQLEAIGADALADKSQRDADALGDIVSRLTTEAPTELATRSQLIPGLVLTEDSITLDGRALDNLSGAEQLRFAVDLAKRLSKAKIIVVDGLERLDATRMREFVAYATAEGWQLIGSRVTEGELVLEAIEPSRVTIELVAPEAAHA